MSVSRTKLGTDLRGPVPNHVPNRSRMSVTPVPNHVPNLFGTRSRYRVSTCPEPDTSGCYLCDGPETRIDLYVNGMPEPICEPCARAVEDSL